MKDSESTENIWELVRKHNNSWAESSKEPLRGRLELIIKLGQLNDTSQKQAGCLINDKGQGFFNARKWRGATSLSMAATNPEVKIRHVYWLGKIWGRSGKDLI